MCNGYRHAPGCECGFGAPYPDIDVRIRKIIEREDRRSSKFVEFSLSFHIPKAKFFHLVDKAGKLRVLTTAAEALQRLANSRFGRGNVKVVPIYIKKGSIDVYVALVVLAMGGAYKFFKDYETIRKGIKAFAKDIKYASSKLNQVVRRKYLQEEQRSLMKTNKNEKTAERRRTRKVIHRK
jgi:hypothetical protein